MRRIELGFLRKKKNRKALSRASVSVKRAAQGSGRRPPPGAAPGTLVADPNALSSVIRVIAYGEDDMAEAQLDSVEQILEYLGRWPVTWVNVDGLGDTPLIERIGAIFNLHRLALEDVVNVSQRAKVEAHDECLYVVMRMLSVEKNVLSEQFSMFIGSNFVLTFQERRGDYFDPVRGRLWQPSGRIRQRSPDYLGYALIDAVIDSYFPIMEHYDQRLDNIEERVQTMTDRSTIGDLHGVRKDLTALRRAVWPKREALNCLARESYPQISENTRRYLRDCYDHTIQVLDMLENLREIASGLGDLYMSGVGNRMNEIMKVLTLISTIFIPLSFIAGLYGMNFDPDASPWNMPELGWYFGYPVLVLLMVVIAGGQIFFFIKKGWIHWPLGHRSDADQAETPSDETG